MNSSDICDMLENVIRCEECFKSFQSRDELEDHTNMHRKQLVQQFAAQQVSKEKIKEIGSSRFPRIDIVRVSMRNHAYMQPFVSHPIKPISSSPNISKKPDSLPKITTLQALDDLFAPTKSTKPKVKSKTSNVNHFETKTPAASKENFLEELDKVIENSAAFKSQNIKSSSQVESKKSYGYNTSISTEPLEIKTEKGTKILKPKQSSTNQIASPKSGALINKATPLKSQLLCKKKQDVNGTPGTSRATVR